MAISYGYNSMPEDDPFVSKAMRHAELVINVVTTERAAIYSALPIREFTCINSLGQAGQQ